MVPAFETGSYRVLRPCAVLFVTKGIMAYLDVHWTLGPMASG